jgi:predicted kinase
MANEVILVNGLPGSGKTTLAVALAQDLRCPVLSKDRFKEALADAVAFPALGPQLGAVAMDTVWQIAARTPELVVVESWWFAPRDREFLRQGLATARAQRSLELWCDVPAELARDRYAKRHRHAVHRDDRDMTEEWRQWTAYGGPVGLGEVERVDTTAEADVADVADRVRAFVATGAVSTVS